MRRICGTSYRHTAQANGNTPSTHPQHRCLPPATKNTPNPSSPSSFPHRPQSPHTFPQISPTTQENGPPSRERNFLRPSTPANMTLPLAPHKSPTKQSSEPGKPIPPPSGTSFHTASIWDTTPPHSRPPSPLWLANPTKPTTLNLPPSDPSS